MKSTWLPCSMKMPEEYTDCLITCKVEPLYCEPRYIVTTARYTDDGFVGEHIEEGVYNITVLAWMPLPEPYKENN